MGKNMLLQYLFCEYYCVKIEKVTLLSPSTFPINTQV